MRRSHFVTTIIACWLSLMIANSTPKVAAQAKNDESERRTWEISLKQCEEEPTSHVYINDTLLIRQDGKLRRRIGKTSQSDESNVDATLSDAELRELKDAVQVLLDRTPADAPMSVSASIDLDVTFQRGGRADSVTFGGILRDDVESIKALKTLSEVSAKVGYVIKCTGALVNRPADLSPEEQRLEDAVKRLASHDAVDFAEATNIWSVSFDCRDGKGKLQFTALSDGKTSINVGTGGSNTLSRPVPGAGLSNQDRQRIIASVRRIISGRGVDDTLNDRANKYSFIVNSQCRTLKYNFSGVNRANEDVVQEARALIEVINRCLPKNISPLDIDELLF